MNCLFSWSGKLAIIFRKASISKRNSMFNKKMDLFKNYPPISKSNISKKAIEASFKV